MRGSGILSVSSRPSSLPYPRKNGEKGLAEFWVSFVSTYFFPLPFIAYVCSTPGNARPFTSAA